jgi:hypothetical protein
MRPWFLDPLTISAPLHCTSVVSGAEGTNAAARAVRARPDGYTLIAGSISTPMS